MGTSDAVTGVTPDSGIRIMRARARSLITNDPSHPSLRHAGQTEPRKAPAAEDLAS